MKFYSFFDTNGDSIYDYYKMKKKNGYFFDKEEEYLLFSFIVSGLNSFLLNNSYDYVIFPETTNQFLIDIINHVDWKADKVILRKHDKQHILKLLSEQKMMKQERLKLFNTIQSMDTIKIANIAANQRNRVSQLLFYSDSDNIDFDSKKVLFFDDSIFTGSTMNAIKNKYNIKDVVVLYAN